MKTREKILLMITGLGCVFVWAAGCRPRQPLDFATAPPARVEQRQPTVPSPAPSSTPKKFEYVSPSGLRVEYPAGWSLELSDSPCGPESVWFRSPDERHADIGLELYPRPLEERSVAEPFTWMPNEGGYEIHWSKPVTAGDLDGLLFVWGVQQEGLWDGPLTLMAVFYDAHRELDIRLISEFGQRQLNEAYANGLEKAVKADFDFFTQMLASLSFGSDP